MYFIIIIGGRWNLSPSLPSEHSGEEMPVMFCWHHYMKEGRLSASLLSNHIMRKQLGGLLLKNFFIKAFWKGKKSWLWWLPSILYVTSLTEVSDYPVHCWFVLKVFASRCIWHHRALKLLCKCAHPVQVHAWTHMMPGSSLQRLCLLSALHRSGGGGRRVDERLFPPTASLQGRT